MQTAMPKQGSVSELVDSNFDISTCGEPGCVRSWIFDPKDGRNLVILGRNLVILDLSS